MTIMAAGVAGVVNAVGLLKGAADAFERFTLRQQILGNIDKKTKTIAADSLTSYVEDQMRCVWDIYSDWCRERRSVLLKSGCKRLQSPSFVEYITSVARSMWRSGILTPSQRQPC